ncbi:hypothetical protein GALL_381780 [mine drainage metagenome]|uniref:Uncharacterized protein n=1 Tax=mine drainage metagenome TaxID=410659 RepID=A0A1J5Q8S0_9ZZZZ
MIVGLLDMTSPTCVNRSTPTQSASATTPTGRPSTTTTAAPWDRFPISVSAVCTVSCGETTTALSTTGCLALTSATTSATTSVGMSWGITARPPRRATVSAIRRPATAVMLATTTGIDVPVPSVVVRSTSNRDATSLADGTRKTSP